MTKQEKINKMVKQLAEQAHAESLAKFYEAVKKAIKKKK